MKMTGGQALVAQLLEEGVSDVFGIPGVQLDWAVEALRQQQDKIRFIVPRHEQAASYMADGYARTTQKEGVSMVVPGPGMLNALSGLATAYACSSRTLFISGQISSDTIGKNLGQLHEIPDQSGILKSLTKWHRLVRQPEEIAEAVHEAFVELRSGHPRPVALEVPPDALQSEATVEILGAAQERRIAPEAEDVRAAIELLRSARFPTIHAGGGAIGARASEAVEKLAEILQAPVCMTEGGRGLISDDHPLALTTLGQRALLPHTDLVLVLGSRFVDARGLPWHTSDNCKFIYVNLDADHLGTPRQSGVAIQADVRATAEALLDALSGHSAEVSRVEQVAKVKAWQTAQTSQIAPQNQYLDAIRSSMTAEDILVSELTQVGFYANVAMPLSGPRKLVTPGYQGTLGYGYPTSLGAAAGNPDQRVVSITGDGGFGWGMQELATANRYGFNVTVVVFNDGHYGNVHRIQKRVFGETYVSKIANPEFVTLAKAFGIPSTQVDSPEGLAAALAKAHETPGPHLVDARVGEMMSPWGLIHPFVPSATPAPENPLGTPHR
ncbi:thiamine pyrophosphate-dependent enzyme [uncultured Hyphomonas sp.]|uniref:thiamine pyrophosphate-dependent enzyme n=1 Tax=uncultured Hyphomonas sp. TaxID=225298 RepID=UPI002AAB616B|nr:thiamine pyrophosphate-dependent enzyme [uncultured Hyphomonas sp.]